MEIFSETNQINFFFLGARHGPSIMPGGAPEAWPHLKDIFQKCAAKVKTGSVVESCCNWVGFCSNSFAAALSVLFVDLIFEGAVKNGSDIVHKFASYLIKSFFNVILGRKCWCGPFCENGS